MPESISMVFGLALLVLLVLSTAVTVAWVRKRPRLAAQMLLGAGLLAGVVALLGYARLEPMRTETHHAAELRRKTQIEYNYRQLVAQHLEPANRESDETGDGAARAAGVRLQSQPRALPDWAKTARVRAGSNEILVVSSSPQFELSYAIHEAQTRATQAIAVDLRRVHPESAGWNPPAPLVCSAIRQSYVEEEEHQAAHFANSSYRVYWQIEITPELRTKMYALWNREVRLHRLWSMAAAVGACTLLLAGAAACFRFVGRPPLMRLEKSFA